MPIHLILLAQLVAAPHVAQLPGSDDTCWTDTAGVNRTRMPAVAWGHQLVLQLSMLILGSEQSGRHGTISGQLMYLPPPRGFHPGDAVHLYYEMFSTIARPALRTTLAICHSHGWDGDATPILQIRFDTPARASWKVVDQRLDLSRLSKGAYRLQLTLADTDGATLTRQSTFVIR